MMLKRRVNIQKLIKTNKEEILSNKKEIDRIEKMIDEKHYNKLQDQK